MNSAARRRRWLVFVAIAATVLFSDQLTKVWVDANFALAYPQPIPGYALPTPIIDGFVRIAKSYNSGVIFGLFDNTLPVPLLAVASTIVIALIVIYHWREGLRSHWLLTVALGLLLGGALGNLGDRINFGHVIDWVDMGIGDMRWYTFNVADAAISTSIVLLLVVGLFGERLVRAKVGEPEMTAA
jgi:signal peptidase II